MPFTAADKEARRLLGHDLNPAVVARATNLSLDAVGVHASDLARDALCDAKPNGFRPQRNLRRTGESHVAQLHDTAVKVGDHTQRMRRAPKLTAEEEQAMIAEFLARKGVTRCPAADRVPD